MSHPERLDELIAAALAVQQRAHAPYSKYFVGAAILAADGRVYSGCNVENASYGLAICAERSAVCQMIAAGCTQIAHIVVASRGGVTPCGACRQVLREFGSDFSVTLIDSANETTPASWTIRELLPGAFDASQL